jgi:peptidoglycan/xylan/chitin deacetylase (PgdA/CDA1 family)
LSSRWPRILNYHAILKLEDDPNRSATSPDQFDAHMLALKRRNMRGVSIRELLRARSTGNTKGLIGLTFDDGYEDFLHSALPILEKYGFSATLFMVAGMLCGENHWEHYYEPRPRIKLLGGADLREIWERGVEIGSHSMMHPKLPGLNAVSLENEVSGSRQVLGEILGEPVEGFCYPYGELDDASIQAVRRARYSYACAVNVRVERSIYDLPRIPISELDNRLRFAAKLKIHSHYRTSITLYDNILKKFRRA